MLKKAVNWCYLVSVQYTYGSRLRNFSTTVVEDVEICIYCNIGQHFHEIVKRNINSLCTPTPIIYEELVFIIVLRFSCQFAPSKIYVAVLGDQSFLVGRVRLKESNKESNKRIPIFKLNRPIKIQAYIKLINWTP